MKWTNELPKEEGFYWLRYSPDNSPYIIKVGGFHGDGMRIIRYGLTDLLDIDRPCHQFAGPIPEPTEWTNKPSKEEGFYWIRKSPNNSPYIIETKGSYEEGTLIIRYGFLERTYLGSFYLSYQFAGPIPEPED